MSRRPTIAGPRRVQAKLNRLSRERVTVNSCRIHFDANRVFMATGRRVSLCPALYEKLLILLIKLLILFSYLPVDQRNL